MRPSRSFVRLDRAAQYRLAKLRKRADTAIVSADPELDRHLAYVVLETVNLWNNFCRSYLLACPFGAVLKTRGKIQLSNAAIVTPGDVKLAAARVQWGATASAPTDRRSEPDWKDKSIFFKTCTAIGVSNLANVQGSLSVQSRVFEDLLPFRNFYAHRNDETATKAVRIGDLQYMIKGKRHPTPVLASAAYKRTQPLILDWIDDMSVVIECLCD